MVFSGLRFAASARHLRIAPFVLLLTCDVLSLDTANRVCVDVEEHHEALVGLRSHEHHVTRRDTARGDVIRCNVEDHVVACLRNCCLGLMSDLCIVNVACFRVHGCCGADTKHFDGDGANVQAIKVKLQKQSSGNSYNFNSSSTLSSVHADSLIWCQKKKETLTAMRTF